MRIILAALALSVAACGPTTEAPAPEAPAGETPAPEVPAADMGPYTGSWDSAEFSRFQHTLHAAEPGMRTIRVTAQTNSPGGETVALYPLNPDGTASTARILFVVADRDGEQSEAQREVPAEGLPVSVVVENASGRPFAGTYTVTVE